MTDSRERNLEALQKATGEKTKSKAIDAAIQHYCAAAGGNMMHPDGTYRELMQLAIEEGSVTPEQIAEILDTKTLPLTYTRDWSVGNDD